MPYIGTTLCDFCKRRRPGGGCDAFPGHIPEEIFYGAHDHRSPYPGDRGVLFELSDELSPFMQSFFHETFDPPAGGAPAGG
jgi:hypothetical protein